MTWHDAPSGGISSNTKSLRKTSGVPALCCRPWTARRSAPKAKPTNFRQAFGSSNWKKCKNRICSETVQSISMCLNPHVVPHVFPSLKRCRLQGTVFIPLEAAIGASWRFQNCAEIGGDTDASCDVARCRPPVGTELINHKQCELGQAENSLFTI